MKIGIDIGSTTIKCVVVDNDANVIYSTYQRHYSHIKENLLKILNILKNENIIDSKATFAISGSAGMGIAHATEVEFIQEVYATRIAANKLLPGIEVIIELGGEDAKILFLKDGMEVRMNGTCAGGTGAFIDQMATLLNVTVPEMNDMAAEHEKIYSIASRCGVFAKTDIQPLLNQGASKKDVSASIFKAVVNQTVGGLAQGRKIEGKVAYLGGPLTFLSELQQSFNETLKLDGICPENSLYYVAIGTALCGTKEYNLDELINLFTNVEASGNFSFNAPLFKNEDELKEFRERHAKDDVKELPIEGYDKGFYLGIDSGSTTLKMVLIDEDDNIRFERYYPNKGNPVIIMKEIFEEIYSKYPNIKILGSASTGYGEDLIRNAFNLDSGLVETIAHYTAAKHFMPEVDFIIDIGGQDIKCFKIENGVISNIFLNEACSSGCGSFLQTFANALGYDIKDFAQMALLAPKPVDLGSRCTVFMNSSVKQAQKDGATIEDISAGLSISIVKNALYKVIRATNVKELGTHIVVQGGTFKNEAVLRAFERELGLNVVCPNISGLMGAYGAALHAKSLHLKESKTISAAELKEFVHNVKYIKCGLCNNHCSLTINTFANNNKFISGNRCERPTSTKKGDDSLNLYQYIRTKLQSYKPKEGSRGKIGIPMVLSMFELYPFWYTFLTSLGFEVHSSGFSNSKTYVLGQTTIPSDTECFPAKLVHGHIETLLNEGYDKIFYPCMSYNFDEHKGDNHYNCPIVAYYPEQIKNNVLDLNSKTFIYDFISVDDKKRFEEHIFKIMQKYFKDITKKEITLAATNAYFEYDMHLKDLKAHGKEIIERARIESKPIIVLAGRPYHVDPEVNHGIDKMITSFDVAVVSEESVADNAVKKVNTQVLNQWTYHARLYAAAKYVTTQPDMNLIQLVSFGCGLDAVTTDECKRILEEKNKIYTQIKIDEITNLGAVRIRLRSLFEALKQQGGNK